MTSWIKIELYYLGMSKKHIIFRSKRWDKKFERMIFKPIYNEKYEKVGTIKDIFGPITLPFISVKADPKKSYDFDIINNFYIKI
ncbi:MAG: hypothetical protein ACTSVV_19165 [Promethearchaeota archaeon]